MTKKIRFITLVMGVVAMFAANALAVTITVNGTTTFDSGGLENATPSPIVGSYWVHTNPGTNVAVLGPTDPGPGAYAGSNYVLLEKDANIQNNQLSAHMFMDMPAANGDQVSTNFAFYMDSTKTELLDAWDLNAFFALKTDMDDYSLLDMNDARTWFGFCPQSPYYLRSNGVVSLDWAGAQADDMALIYYNGSGYQQVKTDGGTSLFANFDTWHEIGVDYTVGGTYTVSIDGVTSSALTESNTTNTKEVIGLQTFVHGHTAAAGYYLEPLANTMTVNGVNAFDPSILVNPEPFAPVTGSYVTRTTARTDVRVLGATDSGPGANEGSNYLMMEAGTGAHNSELFSFMLADTPATDGDQISAELAFYLDSTKTELIDTWDLLPTFGFATGSTIYGGGFGNSRTWVSLCPQSVYYSEGGTNPTLVDWTGAEEDDVAVVYYADGVWSQVTTVDGTAIFTSFDEWHDIILDYTVGGTHTITIDGVTSDALLTSIPSNTGDVIGLRITANGNTAATGFYLDSVASADIAGDANGDGKVDGSDVTILAGNWQKGVSDGLTAIWAEGDFNGDGKVDGSDVTILAGNWQYGVTAAAASVPEPSMLVMLLAFAGGFLVWRRR